MWQDMLQSSMCQINLVAFVVGEAHCVNSGKFIFCIYKRMVLIIVISCTLLTTEETFFRECFSYLGDVRSLILSTF